MIKTLYTLLIYFYKYGTTLFALFHKKAGQRVSGIQNSKSVLLNTTRGKQENIIFIHCSSQGEHEQIRPIIRWILKNTRAHIILSFFSPSGFINGENEKLERITKIYLPFDTPGEMSTLVNQVNPQIAIIVKNEWWWNLLIELKKQQIPTYLVSSTFRNNHYFIKYPFNFFKNGIATFEKIFVVDKESKTIISKIAKSGIIVSGDTRIDQVNYLKDQKQNKTDQIPKILASSQVIVYGSVWESDFGSIRTIISEFPNYLHLIYPHELHSSNLIKLQGLIPGAIIVDKTKSLQNGINIISSMGELKNVYRWASIAYIGGGFGEGIHNILEAAVYSIPTIFGPNYNKSNEAKYLVKKEAAFSFKNTKELKLLCSIIKKEKFRNQIESNLKAYFSPKISPTEIICNAIFLKN